ncbi:MAG: hypothetical protein NWE89_16255 [Candidatus Bathyarchaeota archaeon]|nr:hypothetical protein [Candidatus Bathyarchaeota archaeon]
MNFDSIYLHAGITSTITTSFSSVLTGAMDPEGLTLDGGVPTRRSGNLISSGESSNSVFIHVGITSTITTSFSHLPPPEAGPIDVTVDASGNLITSRCEWQDTIRIHAGITDTVTTSFSTPAGDCRGITIDASGNLISDDAGTFSGYIHAGITSTITTSFSIAASYIDCIEVSEAGNLLVTDYNLDRIYIHAGITSTVTSFFASPKSFPWGLTIRHPGWTGEISGVSNPAVVMGVAVANIAAVKGVA